MVFLDGIKQIFQCSIQWVNTMVNSPGYINLERNRAYATCHVLFRVHTLLHLNKLAYALQHNLFIIILALSEFLPSATSELICRYLRFTLLTTHQVSFHHEQLHQVGFHQGQHMPTKQNSSHCMLCFGEIFIVFSSFFHFRKNSSFMLFLASHLSESFHPKNPNFLSFLPTLPH